MSKISLEILAVKNCPTVKASDPVLIESEIDHYLDVLSTWKLDPQIFIYRKYQLSDYEQTLMLVNAIAQIAEINDHHPEVTFTYNTCLVSYSTHVNHGLTENDFICAAKIDKVFNKLNN